MSKREEYPPGTVTYGADYTQYQVGGPSYPSSQPQGPPAAKYAQFASGGPPSTVSSTSTYLPPASGQYPYSPTTTSYTTSSASYGPGHHSMPYAPDSPVHSPTPHDQRRHDAYYEEDASRAYREAERDHERSRQIQLDYERERIADIEHRERLSELEYQRRMEEQRRIDDNLRERDRIADIERREIQSELEYQQRQRDDRARSRDPPRDRTSPPRSRSRSRSRTRKLNLDVKASSSISLTKSSKKSDEKRKKKEKREDALAWSNSEDESDTESESDSGSASSGKHGGERHRRHHRHKHREHRYSHSGGREHRLSFNGGQSPRLSSGGFQGGHSPRHSTSSFHSSHASESGGRYLTRPPDREDYGGSSRRTPREHRPSMNALTTNFDRMELMAPQSARPYEPPSPSYRYYDDYDLSPLPSPRLGPADSSRSFDFSASGGFSISRPSHGSGGDKPPGWPSLSSGAPNFLKPSILKKSDEGRYDPSDHAEALYKALKGSSGDPGPIIKILPTLSGSQILKLRYENKKVHPKGNFNLVKQIKSKLSGNFKLAAWMTASGPWESECYWSIFSNQKSSTRYMLLTEALLGRTNDEIIRIKESFKDKHGNTLESAIRKELASDKNTGERFKSMVMQQLDAKRMEEWDTVYYDRVRADVEDLHRALSKTPKADTQTVVDIIIPRNNTHLRETMKLYKQVHDKDLAKTIITKISNLVGEGLLHILNGVLNRPLREARLLEASMKGAGTRDDLLISRLIRIHWEPELMQAVKQAYKEKYHRTLRDRIAGDTSGDYQTFLIAMTTVGVTSKK